MPWKQLGQQNMKLSSVVCIIMKHLYYILRNISCSLIKQLLYAAKCTSFTETHMIILHNNGKYTKSIIQKLMAY